MKFQLPNSTRNWVSLIGATIAVISFSMIVFLFTITVVTHQGHVYLGLVMYIVLPAIMVLGLLLIPVGMYIQSKRALAQKGTKPWPYIDLNIPSHRNAFFIFALGTTVFLFATAVGSYEAFHYTESTEFCGTLCHKVMKPEYVAYQNTAHARVACVDCHVGSGADWYVRSKLNGLHQVYSTAFNRYPRPIPTPVKNLRPAEETCQTCHWSEKYYAHKLRNEVHYKYDEENTPWEIKLIMKIGAENSAHGLTEGIHWHNNPDVKIEYIAADPQRSKLPWVKYTNLATGEVKIYQDEEEPLSDSTIATAEIRTMDCMDCHNRPAHHFQPPVQFVNTLITAGRISRDLPEIKTLLTDLCEAEYSTLDSALVDIENQIREFYESDYPEIYESEREKIDNAITAFQQEYSKNVFPEMRARWDRYPNHIGHVETDGCFRCHNDTHATDDGITIRKDCNLCHIITAQGTPGVDMEIARVGEALEFRHPDGDEDWKDGLCTDCHTGLNP